MIRALVVDDSAFMRRVISQMLDEDPQIEVIGTGKNGVDAVEMARTLKPDVMTLDIEMPEMDGLTALRVIMRECPTRVLMCSSLTTEGSIESLRALRIGAVDVIAKDHSTFSTKMGDMREDLLMRIKAIASSRGRFSASRSEDNLKSKSGPVSVTTGSVARPTAKLPDPIRGLKAVCIGSSTGGPPVLEFILDKLPAEFPYPVVVAQHMPEVFTASMTARLATACKMNVAHCGDGDPVSQGTITIMKGGRHHKLTGRGPSARLREVADEREIYKPSVNILLESASEVFGGAVLGIVLTGIGRDGAEGAKVLKKAGGTILAQDESTSVVYGMPKAVAEDGTALANLAPSRLVEVLLQSANVRAAA